MEFATKNKQIATEGRNVSNKQLQKHAKHTEKRRTSNKAESAEMMIFLNPGMLMLHPEYK